MLIKLFFLAAASAMFMAYQAAHSTWSPRKPSSLDTVANQQTLCYAPGYPMGFQCTPPSLLQIPPSNKQIIYNYGDFNQTFSTAIQQETALRQQMTTMQGMLATEEQRLATMTMDIHERANPYNPARQTVNKLKNDIEKIRLLRHNNLDMAYLRLYLTYAAIQNPLQKGDTRKSLTPEQHKEAANRLDFILQLKRAVQFDGTTFALYPTTSPYLTAGINPIELQTAPNVIAPPVEQKPAVVEVKQPQTEKPLPPDAVEPVLEEQAATEAPVLQ